MRLLASTDLFSVQIHCVSNPPLAASSDHIGLQPVPLAFTSRECALTAQFIVLPDVVAGIDRLAAAVGRPSPAGSLGLAGGTMLAAEGVEHGGDAGVIAITNSIVQQMLSDAPGEGVNP